MFPVCVGEGVVVVEEIASVGVPKLFGNDVKVDTIHLNSMLSELYCGDTRNNFNLKK